MKTLLILLVIIITSCKHDPEFFINGKGYYTTEHCKKDSAWSEYTWHYGYSYRGKFEYYYGNQTKYKCLVSKLDTVNCDTREIYKP